MAVYARGGGEGAVALDDVLDTCLELEGVDVLGVVLRKGKREKEGAKALCEMVG